MRSDSTSSSPRFSLISLLGFRQFPLLIALSNKRAPISRFDKFIIAVMNADCYDKIRFVFLISHTNTLKFVLGIWAKSANCFNFIYVLLLNAPAT